MTVAFVDCKYTVWYYHIINQRRYLTPAGYVERHHVSPKSVGGTNDAHNIVKLTAREHFVCHWLLTKMFTQGSRERQKMSLALHRMAYGMNASKYRINARTYESIRKLNVNAIRYMQKERFKDPIVKVKQAEYALGASRVAAERAHNNPVYSEACSKRTRKQVDAGTHNFLGGKIQKAMWDDPIFREKQHQLLAARIIRGTHPFQQPEFIERQRIRLKTRWANMTPEERAERGKKISQSKKGKPASNKGKKLAQPRKPMSLEQRMKLSILATERERLKKIEKK